MNIFDTVAEWASGKKVVMIDLLYSVILWPPLDGAAPDYPVSCGSGLYSSRNSSCTGTEGKVVERHIERKAAPHSCFSSLG